MTNLLRKIFIRNYQNITDEKVRQKHGFLASFVGIFTNLLLFVFKIIIGIVTFSIAIIADAINNLTDMGSCFVNLFGFIMAGKPADKEHPFGHQRIEYIAGMIISFIIIGVALLFAYQSVQKVIANEGSDPSIYTFIILISAILLKLWQGLFYKKLAKIINSVSLKASGQDSINDVITTSTVLIASLIEFILKLNKISAPFSIDGVMGTLVSIFIIIVGIKMVIETANPLIGIHPDKQLLKQIEKDILTYNGVLGIHDVMFHSYGPTKGFMTVHVEVDQDVNICVSHDIIDNIENDIKNKYGVILTIHMDPIDTKSEDVKLLKGQTKIILEKYDKKLKFHDFRVVNGVTHTNVIFDIVIPYEKKKYDETKLLSYLKEQFNQIKTTYNLVVKIDYDYDYED
ncbi:MAG: cation diffusion facilitator family transporter [Bacilli bacterium]|nr:cation diffusion facilitator family transporter [Bacilli bacterium]